MGKEAAIVVYGTLVAFVIAYVTSEGVVREPATFTVGIGVSMVVLARTHTRVDQA